MAAAAVHEDPMATAQDVQQQLATIKAPGTFATRRSSPADDLRLEVTGVGRIGWPITRETARKLCVVARPARSRLRSELHNLLVYGPGQFFLTHQDSEKADDMIGTLIVVLPSNFTGGAIEI